jgi:hypothetical protein
MHCDENVMWSKSRRTVHRIKLQGLSMCDVTVFRRVRKIAKSDC